MILSLKNLLEAKRGKRKSRHYLIVRSHEQNDTAVARLLGLSSLSLIQDLVIIYVDSSTFGKAKLFANKSKTKTYVASMIPSICLLVKQGTFSLRVNRPHQQQEQKFSVCNNSHIYLHVMYISVSRKPSLSGHRFTKNNYFLEQENPSFFSFCLRFSINDDKFILKNMRKLKTI